MSTLTVTNIQTANSSVPLTLTTGNTTAGDIIVNNDQVLMFANSTTNVTINSTSIAIAGVSKIGAGTANASGNQITVTQQLFLSGNVTPTKLAANTSAWNQASGVYNIRAEANSTTEYYSLFGLTAGLNGQEITITNINATPIIIRNEDSVNESTAANRFNMPNHIKLDGYMSAQFYYDGTLSRWRLVDSVNIPFDHKSLLTKGFFTGGGNALNYGEVVTADKIDYSNDTRTAIVGANLSQARGRHGAAGNSTKGFFAGGYARCSVALPYQVATTDRTTYSSESTAAVSGANLSGVRSLIASAGNSDKGFFSGGNTPTIVATAERITYSLETTGVVSGANLSSARCAPKAVGNADKGFFSGGATPTLVATADRTTYSTETTAAVSGANLSQARNYVGSAGNSDKGFFTSGSTGPAAVTTADRTTYSTETTAAVSGANISQGRYDIAGAGSADKGFFSGGFSPSPLGVFATTDRITYSSETNAAVTGANLSSARWGAGAI